LQAGALVIHIATMDFTKKIPICLAIPAFLIIALLSGIRPCYSQIKPGDDSVTCIASSKYKHPGIFLRIAFGNNYRKEWGQTVIAPLFDITKEQGGLTITKEGGGHQTKGLKMISADSTEWALRSIDKSVEKFIPKLFKHSFIERTAQYMISASHPYACLSVSELAKAAGVMTPDPKLVYLPNDTSLGTYRKKFADDLYFFEQRHPLLPHTRPENMEDLLERLQKDNREIILQREMLKARLLDMITGDWDRHQGQWRWGKYDSLGITWYYPIPTDRDQAFFRGKGMMIKLVSLFAIPFLKGFKKNINELYQLNKTARNLDRTFLNELTYSDWEKIAIELNNNLTDSVIMAAINKLPKEIPQYRKERIGNILRNRRDGLRGAGIKYYKRLSKKVYVFGSEKVEYFEIKNINNDLQVTVYNSPTKCDSCKIYQRTFNRKQTRLIYLVSIRGDDKLILPTGKTNIRIRRILPVHDGKYDLRRKMLERLRAKGQA